MTRSSALLPLTDGMVPGVSLDFTVNQYLVDVRTWESTVAGLLFSKNPSVAVPKECAVKVARYETREEDPERDHLKETFTVEGPLYQQIHLTVAKLKEIMSSTPIWTMEGVEKCGVPARVRMGDRYECCDTPGDRK